MSTIRSHTTMIRRHAPLRLALVSLLGCTNWGCGERPAVPQAGVPTVTSRIVTDADGASNTDPAASPGSRPSLAPSAAAETQPPVADGSQAGLRPALRPYAEWTLAETAADSLGRMGPAAVTPLIEMLRDPDPARRLLAARTLARLGPDAQPAVPELILTLQDADLEVRIYAARALGQIGPEAAAAVPALIRSLEAGSP